MNLEPLHAASMLFKLGSAICLYNGKKSKYIFARFAVDFEVALEGLSEYSKGKQQ